MRGPSVRALGRVSSMRARATSRRGFLRVLGGGAAIGLLAACGQAPAAPTAAPAAKPAEKPADAKPAGATPAAAAPVQVAAGQTKIRFAMSNNADTIKRWVEPMTKAFEEKNPTI